jgi:hypothetical protein
MANDHQHEHQHTAEQHQTERKLSVSKLVLIGFLIVAAYFLFTEHRAHTIAFLPYALLLACPFMHFFMHGGHGGHDHGNRDNDKKGDA